MREPKPVMIAREREKEIIEGTEELGCGRALQWDGVSGGVDFEKFEKL